MKWQKHLFACALLLLTAACAGTARRGERPAAADLPARAAQTLNAAQSVRISADGADAAEPAVAAGRDGTAYVAWVEHGRAGEADVWLARFDGAGQPLTRRVRVNPEPGGATAWFGDPPTVAVAPDGTVYVGWTARAVGGVHASTLELSASRDGGQSVAAPVRVNDDDVPGVHGLHSLAVAPDGRVCVAWLDERNVAPPPQVHAPATSGHHLAESNRDVFFAFSADGGRSFSPNRRVAAAACPCCKTSVVAGTDGRVYVGWRQVLPGDYRHVAVTASADGGRTFAPAVVVSDDRWQLAGCPVSGPALSIEADGALRVLWYSAGEAGAVGLYWSESRDGGRTFEPRRAFAGSSGRATPSLLSHAAVWEDKDDGGATCITTAHLTTDGEAAPSAVVARAGELPAAAEAQGQMFVAYISKTAERRALWLARTQE